MELDDYLSQLNKDLEQSLQDVNKALSTSGFGMSQTATSSPASTAQSPAFTAQSSAASSGQSFIFCPECGTRLPADSLFCGNCGTRLAQTSDSCAGSAAFSSPEASCGKAGRDSDCDGIIFTNTDELARKYNVARADIQRIITSYIDDCQGETDWVLLDMADHYGEMGEGTWMDYSDVLQQFINDHGIQARPQLSLFIIGGNDVIPQPAEKNPCGDPADEYQELVYADFYYCFYGELPLDFLDFNKARCNVARLPLEMGRLSTNPRNDIGRYLQRAADINRTGGIKIGNAVMTSNEDWIPASREMSRNLPTPHMDDEEGVTMDNMYISPSIMAEGMEDDLESRYTESLAEADMLVFNLHGACRPNQSGFYSDGLAFSIDMLSSTNAPIFNTVACWGGRYIKYKREDSMLMNAIYGAGVMLYSGACVPALGKCGNFQCDSTWRIQPAAYSETFMARFCEYQCIGAMPAGEAFLRAKCDYYNSSRCVEEDECTLGTVLMFNLFGCPLLKTCPDENELAEIQTDDGSKMQRMPFRKMQREVVLGGNGAAKTQDGSLSGSSSLIADIRNAVDNNLRAIHEAVTASLYQQLGVEPRELFCVERYSSTDAYGLPEKGYLYNYRRQGKGFVSEIRAKVNEQGQLLSAIQTK